MVLGIVALIAAVLLPVLSRVRERGHCATCQSNLRQLAMAVQQYKADADGMYPFGGSHEIFPYVKDIAVYSCPSIDPNFSDGVHYPPPAWLSSEPVVPIHYEYNNWVIDRVALWIDHPPYHYKGTNESVLSEHTSDIWLWACFDESQATVGTVSIFSPNPYYFSFPTCTAGPYTTGPYAHHSGGTNYAFLDGHVKWLNTGQEASQQCTLPLEYRFDVKPPPR
jgi:prepilin-type processing-associated H-X9-DG protein